MAVSVHELAARRKITPVLVDLNQTLKIGKYMSNPSIEMARKFQARGRGRAESKYWRLNHRGTYTSKKKAPIRNTGTVAYFSQSPGLVASHMPRDIRASASNCRYSHRVLVMEIHDILRQDLIHDGQTLVKLMAPNPKDIFDSPQRERWSTWRNRLSDHHKAVGLLSRGRRPSFKR